MFKAKTVFVVGAGCSVDLGFPSGPTLMDEVRDIVAPNLHGDGLFAEAFLRAGMNTQNWQNQRRAFVAGLHGQPSIDQYLNFHKDDKIFETMGKLAIAQIILNRERSSILRAGQVKDGLKSLSSTWMIKLFHLMATDVPKEAISEAFDNVSFICFNYDRCIETALYLALIHTARLPSDEAATLISALRIWHPYGSVGEPVDWPMGGFRENDLEALDVIQASKRIRTFSEGMADDTEREAMLRELQTAAQVVFLGFSYGPDNMRLLKLPEPSELGVVLANTYRLSASNAAIAKEHCGASLAPGRTIMLRDKVFRTPVKADEVIDQFGPALRDGMLGWQVTHDQIREAYPG